LRRRSSMDFAHAGPLTKNSAQIVGSRLIERSMPPD
jgi:hypothetical protein